MMTFRTIALLVCCLAISPCTTLHAQTSTPPAGKADGPVATAPAPPPAAVADDKLPAVPTREFPAEQAKLDAWKNTLDYTESTISQRPTNSRLNFLRERASEAQSGAREIIAAMTPTLDAAVARSAELAPNPKSTTPQSDTIKLERAKLLAEIAGRQSIVQQARLINVRAQQILDTISEQRRAVFADSVLQRSESMINPSFWIGVGENVSVAADRLVELISDWGRLLASQPLRTAFGLIVAAIVLLGFFLSPGRRWHARWTTRDPEASDPAPLRKTGSAAAIVVAGTAIPGVALLVLYHSLLSLGLLPEELRAIVRALFFGSVFAIFLVRLTTAVLAPGLPSWRLIGLRDAAAESMLPVAAAMGVVIAFGIAVEATNLAINSPPELSLASHGVVAIVIGVLFMAALRIVARAEADDDDAATAGADDRSAWRLLVPIGWVFATAAVLGPLGGYVAFGRFVSGEMVVVVTVLMSFVLLSRFADAVIAATFTFSGGIGRFLRQATGLPNAAVRQLAAVLSGFVQLVLVALSVFVVLATWGISSEDVLDSISSAFFSFTIGKFTISPSAILGAIIVLILGILATRAVQRWLDGRFLPETSLDAGVRSSIRTGVGYIGVILAGIVALSYIGLDLQNIAIVAGALSVGIGFGLQSIINNFVSGLILLVERPIKVGDRIEVGTRMGVVRRINVRATEIVTYDNLSVIVPNAELISGQVVNWMHGSFSARLSVTVGTAYNADPDKVIAILLEIVSGHPRALRVPEPFAILSNFGADALEFMVFFHVGNIGLDAGAANEVRLEILKRFRKEGIEIPFAQRDIHLRDLDRLEALVREVGRADRSQVREGDQ